MLEYYLFSLVKLFYKNIDIANEGLVSYLVFLFFNTNIHIYIYMCVGVCVRACVRVLQTQLINFYFIVPPLCFQKSRYTSCVLQELTICMEELCYSNVYLV